MLIDSAWERNNSDSNVMPQGEYVAAGTLGKPLKTKKNLYVKHAWWNIFETKKAQDLHNAISVAPSFFQITLQNKIFFNQ